MQRPRRPSPCRPSPDSPRTGAAGSGSRSAARRSERVRAGVRRGAEQGRAPAYVGLTTRAAVLGLVLCALLVSAALPLREYLSQRSQISQVQQTEASRRSAVSALQAQKALLADPTYVAALARERLHFVKPGETTYVVLGAEDPSLTARPDAASRPAGPLAPWWSQLYGSVRAADQPAR